ncbi:telomere repeat-binding factor 1 [Impatiens glandulifera]|uniref:telomere repeat-binding factor 1 n=1 Tax=Impatiens glandulifera TaxID=253017 RepID=UPI001FB0E999|nr:telomere repeat-binding factor 1 [Impatiens glandulifera]XP_047307323.1 telomere repeat-binding factor 1 [Impatiens glandulifera]XP_047307324.1 telomere repeat-binding factor 1 [Impatiens glandulifera]
MGAPKQKWTAEEEAALKSGVSKHGAGKWRTILKDPEYSAVLYLRSNVDLKDKWRNMSVMAHGWGSREKARLALKRMPLFSAPKQDGNSLALSLVGQNNEDTLDAKPLAMSKDYPLIAAPKRPLVRLDNLIMEAISNLKETSGSNKTAIASFIEEQYWSPPNFKRLLSAKLKYLTANGKLIKMKRKYRIAPPSPSSSSMEKKKSSPILFQEGRSRSSPKLDMDEIPVLTKAQVDLELAKMRKMTPEDAAAAAARAVADAEAAIAEAEEAAKEAEAAEADAEAAQAFAEAAVKTLNGRNIPRTMIPA